MTSNALPRQKSFKSLDDVTSLTTFNPFSEEDEHDQSSYAIVTSLLSLVKNTLTAPLSSSSTNHSNPQSNNTQHKDTSTPTALPPRTQSDKPKPSSLSVANTTPAPPLVFLTPVISEAPSLGLVHDSASTRSGMAPSPIEPSDPTYGTTIPGFPIADDARSVRTTGSGNLQRTASVSKIIRRIRGEGS